MTEPKKRNAPRDRMLGSYLGHPRGFGFLVLDGGAADLTV